MSGDQRRLLEHGTAALLGVLCAGLLAAALDTQARSGATDVPALEHLHGVLMLFSVPAAWLGVIAALMVASAVLLGRRVGPKWVRLGSCLTVAAGAAWLARGPLRITLGGPLWRAPDLAKWLLRGSLAALALGAGLLLLVTITLADERPKRRWLAPTVGAALALCGAAIMWGDLHVAVALYASAHELAEAIAWCLAASGAYLLALTLVRRSASWRFAGMAAAGAGWLWALWFVGSAATRASLDERLTHVWREHAYGARMSLRLQLAEAYLRDPGGWSGKLGSRLDRLVERYDIATTAQSPSWDLPSVAAATAAPTRAPLNVLVVFVDTLRADTAHSTSVMPRLNALRGESLSFERAYAAASDTVSVLPVLTGGCYGQVPCPGDVLAVARQLDIRTGLVIARSAQRFLGKLSPHFAFDDVVAIPDYEEGQKVWGYGATGTTARGVTREALAWMAQHRGERFLLWAFHFDVHNWMHLEDAHLTAVAARHDIEKSTEDRHWRYAAAVAGVDEAIGELVDGMQTQGLFDDTALLIVSDHGEALGQHGHAYHAVYLWQSLVHVPMLLHVKGVAARDVQTPAGHVDVAPTVLSLLAPDAPRLNYHGASLIDGDAELSANPLLMLSMRKDDLLRIGIVDRHPPFMKLELPLDSVEPELYDLDASDPDATDVRADNRVRALELLSGLVTSPVFPRPEGEEDAKSPGARE